MVAAGGIVEIHTVSAISRAVEKARRGDGTIHPNHFLRGSAAIRARSRASNPNVGSTAGSSASTIHTARYCSTRARHAAQSGKWLSTWRRSFTSARPSTNEISNFEIDSHFITIFLFPFRLSAGERRQPLARQPSRPAARAALAEFRMRGTITILARSPCNRALSISARNPFPRTCEAKPPPVAYPAERPPPAESTRHDRFPAFAGRYFSRAPAIQTSARLLRPD